MSSGNFFKSDLYTLHNIVQNSMIAYTKDIVIATLRDFFSRDSYYHYVKDDFGFPNTPDHTDLPITAGLTDNTTTRLYIGENWRFDVIFYPAILVKNGGGRYVPISINMNKGDVHYSERAFQDGYGNISIFRNPDAFLFNGAWEGDLIIDIKTRSLRSRDELMDLVAIGLQNITFEALKKSGVIVKPLSWGSPSEIDDRNDKLFQQSFTIPVRTEWERRIPITNMFETLNFVIEFGRLDINPLPPAAPNLSIKTEITLFDLIMNPPTPYP